MARRRPLIDELVHRYPRRSRDEWFAAVMCGEVLVDGGVCTDPRRPVAAGAAIEHRRDRYVSRGGHKLEHVLRAWDIPASGRVWLDAGASTGGFTDCLLQHGARAVHAVDVGYNQLAWRLRSDARVHVHERTNALALPRLDPPPDAAVCDLSFRSLRGVLGRLLRATREGWGIALLKPQFEAAADERWGTRDPGALIEGVISGGERTEVIDSTVSALERDEGIVVRRMAESPIAGHDGNREVLLLVACADPVRANQAPKSAGESGSPT